MGPVPDRSEKPCDSELGSELLGKDEMNLAEFPITLLTDRAPGGQTRIERQIRVYDEAEDQFVTRRVTVTASEQYGVPTAKDNEVLLGLIYLTKRANNFSERRVHYHRSELVRVLGWPNKGQSYTRIFTS